MENLLTPELEALRYIRYEAEDRIGYITLNRPDKRNAFNAEMLVRLADAWDMIDSDPEVRVAILTGAGGHFSAGGDVEGFAFNKAIARLYELAGAIGKAPAGAPSRRFALRVMAQLSAPMTPHLAEELWAMAGGEGMVARAPWPEADASLLVEASVTEPVRFAAGAVIVAVGAMLSSRRFETIGDVPVLPATSVDCVRRS